MSLFRQVTRSATRSRVAYSRPSQTPFRRWATSSTLNSLTADPAEAEASKALDDGTKALEEGDVASAKAMNKLNVSISRVEDFPAAIEAWKESIELQPSSADAHTNLASAYIMSPVSRPDLALHHLRTASSISPEDPEIAFNLGAVLEACGLLQESLEQYKRAKDNGVERAAVHIRNVSAKILGQKLKAQEELANQSSPSETTSPNLSSNSKPPSSD